MSKTNPPLNKIRHTGDNTRGGLSMGELIARPFLGSDLDESFRRVTAISVVFELSGWIAKRRPNYGESILC